ncbi:sigma 54-interacting transcriptional regulator [Streptomyces sp. NPDC090994]|uniref:sigma 54-interacting transcriptional regulator n=1 Tax=Streptomyces sp. NPDC090994 TaxID=3365969 RepID=UPI00380E730F
MPWRRAVERAAELAMVRAPLLLTGERGTGKTTLARELACTRRSWVAAEAPRARASCRPGAARSSCGTPSV